MTTAACAPTGPSLASPEQIAAVAASLLGTPVELQVLKHKPGRRRTWRATGRSGALIIKSYTSGRAGTVGGRLRALVALDSPVTVPRVLRVEPKERLVALTDVPGTPWRNAIIDCDDERCRDVGVAIARWHGYWADQAPAGLAAHTPAEELRTLERQLAGSPPTVRQAVMTEARTLAEPWPCTTAAHRDLYEDQVVLHGHGVGLIDLDDAAIGPPELDVGNLLAHLDLHGLRHQDSAAQYAASAFLDGYRVTAQLDEHLLRRCRRLAQLRLACIHEDQRDSLLSRQ